MPRMAKPEDLKSIRINITMEPALERRLREYAEENERPISWIVQKAVIAWLDQQQK